MNEFKSLQDAVKFTRASLKQFGKFSVGYTAKDAFERQYERKGSIFVRWKNDTPYDTVYRHLLSLDVTLHAGRGPVRFILTRTTSNFVCSFV